MSKKILAGVLAAASILSVSAVASAADDAKVNNATYTVTAGVTEGEVDVTLPEKTDIEKGIFLNPYKTAVKTDSNKNTSEIASKIFTVKNNDADDPIKVMATVSITKASGVVVKDMAAKSEDVKGADSVGADSADECEVLSAWNPLVDYTAIKTKTVTNDDKTKTVEYVSGGAKVEAAKQKKNVGLWLSGSTTKTAVINTTFDPEATTGQVGFLPKGTKTGELIANVPATQDGYFAVNGAINPEFEGEWTMGKDTLGMTIIIKCMPTVDSVAP